MLPRAAQKTDLERRLSDCFYEAAKAIAKFLYTKIEERYAELPKEPKYEKRKNALMDEVKSILNEHRNLVLRDIAPNFVIEERSEPVGPDEKLSKHDACVHDLTVKNVFAQCVKHFLAWLPEFVHAENVASCEEVIVRLSVIQRDKLESDLRNFKFTAKKIIAPKR